MELEEITRTVIVGAIDVHRAMGPGLLESVYQTCMMMELADRRLAFERQKSIPGFYKGRQIDCVYRPDLIVEGRVIVELKSVVQLEPVHMAQVLTYVRLTGCEAGLLINFNVDLLKHGIRRVTDFTKAAPTRKERASITLTRPHASPKPPGPHVNGCVEPRR